MFGYVTPFKDELKLKEIKRYKRYYCALCNQLRIRYGRISTIFLSYELIFTLILLDDFCDPEKLESVQLSCQFDVIHIGEIQIKKDLIMYIGWVNLYLSLWKLKDNWLDERELISFFLYKLLLKNKIYMNDCEAYADAAAFFDSKLSMFYELERKNCCDFDALAQLMGEVWQGIIEYGAKYTNIEHDTKQLIKGICDDLAKFLYCIDAYDDYEKDIKNKQFNPLTKMRANLDEGVDNGIFLLSFIIYNLKHKIVNIQLHQNSDILKNIILFGLEYKLSQIEKRKEKENAKKFPFKE